MNKFQIILLLLSFTSFSSIKAQSVYAGGSYTASILDDTGIYTPQGFGISIFKDFNLSDSKFSVINHVNVSFLYSELNQPFSPAYFAALSGSSAVAYKLISVGRFSFKPFLGPFGSWTSGLKSNLVLNQAETVDFWQYGFKTGLVIDVKICKNFDLRLIPWSAQYGKKQYRQGFIELAISID